MSDEGIAELLQLQRESTEQVARAVDAIGELAATLAEQDRRSRWVSRLLAGLAVVVLGAGLLSFSNRQVIDALKDCTEPGGRCFDEAQERQARVVGPMVESLERIEQRGDSNRRLLCLGVPDTRRPAELCPPDILSPTTTTP